MRGTKTPDEKVQSARELRRGGLSFRQIARKLRISKTAAHRFTKDVPAENPAEQVSRQAEELFPAGGMEFETGTNAEQIEKEELPPAEPIDEELASLRERLWDIKARVHMCRPGDEREISDIQRELDHLRPDLQRYLDHRLRSIGCHSPPLQFARNRSRDHVLAQPQTSQVTSRELELNARIEAREQKLQERIARWQRKLEHRNRQLALRIWDRYASKYAH
jgi:hypothetical protein